MRSLVFHLVLRKSLKSPLVSVRMTMMEIKEESTRYLALKSYSSYLVFLSLFLAMCKGVVLPGFRCPTWFPLSYLVSVVPTWFPLSYLVSVVITSISGSIGMSIISSASIWEIIFSSQHSKYPPNGSLLNQFQSSIGEAMEVSY